MLDWIYIILSFVSIFVALLSGKSRYNGGASDVSILGRLLGVLVLILVGSVWVVNNTFKKSDILSGRTAVQSYRSANILALVMIIVVFILWIGVFVFAVSRPPFSVGKVFCVLFVLAAIVAVGAWRMRALARICSDLRRPTDTAPKEYVLSTAEKEDSREWYYICFEERGDYIMLAVPENDFEKMKKCGTPKDSTTNDAYTMVCEAGYSDVQSYSNNDMQLNVEYYFNSAIYIGMK